MNFLQRLFGNNDPSDPSEPNIKFGRYSDSYKKPAQYEAWDESLENFEKENYLVSFDAFFRYLRDDKDENVKWQEENGAIQFEFYQGSKKIFGTASIRNFKAEAKVAKARQLNIGFMRRLIEQNFDLKYSRFALDDQNDIAIVFDTSSLDGSPYKLYYALKEMAVNADKMDDLLIDEFDVLEQIESSHILDLSEPEKEAKYAYIQSEITKVFEEIDHGKLRPEQYPGAIAYLLLDLSYRLDYLISPEGFMMERLEKIHRLYFENDGKTTPQKTALMRKNLDQLTARTKEEFFKEMYRVKATFGITTPVNHDRVAAFIDGELHNMDWYKDNRHERVAMAIPGYIVGYCLFNYAAPKPVRELFHLYFKITEQEFFNSLGFSLNFQDARSGELNRKNIKSAIEKIVKDNERIFPKLKPDFFSLNYSSRPEFAKSYLAMIRNLDTTKVD